MALPKYHKKDAAPKAAPKKRVREVRAAPSSAPVAPSRKKRRNKMDRQAESAEADFKMKCDAIAEAILEVDLPYGVRDMLCSTLSGCFTSVSFHPYQRNIIEMLQETLDAKRIQIANKVQKDVEMMTEENYVLQQKEVEHSFSKTRLAEIDALIKHKEDELSGINEAAQASKFAGEKVQEGMRRGDTKIGTAVMECEQLRSKAGEADYAQQMATLTEVVSNGALARMMFVAELKAAQDAHDDALAKHMECQIELGHAKSSRNEPASAAKFTAQMLEQQRKVACGADTAHSRSQRSLQDFETNALVVFNDLVAQIEKNSGVSILKIDGVGASIAKLNSGSAALQPIAPTPSGTPVIDRRQHQAVLRRRSAALPSQFFSRVSLSRRNSLAMGGRASIMTAGPESPTTDSIAANAIENAAGELPHDNKYFVEETPMGGIAFRFTGATKSLGFSASPSGPKLQMESQMEPVTLFGGDVPTPNRRVSH